jgi:hypothetical protein
MRFSFIHNISHLKKNSASQRDIIANVGRFSCKVIIILVRFESNMIPFYRFYRNADVSYFMKIRPAGAQLFRTYRRTDKQTDG